MTQQVDPESPVLGATVAKIRALAARVDEVAVIADGAVPGALPANCHVHTFAAGTKMVRGARFEAALARELARRPLPSAVVAHMCPIYAVLAAPLARPLGVDVLLWYTHWRSSRLLAVAERVSSAVVTVDRRSFPLHSPKVIPIGHGIDLGGYRCVERPARDGLALLTLGRTSPAKGLETVVRAVAQVPGVRLRQYGPSLTDEERRHRGELERLAAELGIADRVTIGGPVAAGEVPGLLAAADCLVNNMRAGATDKVVFEAAATCLPVLASNPALDHFLSPELMFPRDDAAALAARIGEIGQADRGAIGNALRCRVEQDHSVEGWAARVIEVASR